MDFESDGANRYSLLLLVLTVSLLCVGTLPTVTATSSASPPPIPAGYYGEVMINGEPADVGTTVEVEINDEIRGSIDVTKSGQYGSSKAGGKRLTVTGSNAESGTATVAFYVEGNNFDRTKVQNTNPKSIVWQSQDIRQVNLSASVELNPSDSDSGSGGGGGAGGGGGGAGSAGRAPAEQSPPSIEDVRSTLSLVNPSASSETQIQDTDPDTSGVTVTTEGTQSVQSIRFNSEATGSVQVTEYSEPPQEIRDQVAQSISGAVTSDGGSSDSDEGDSGDSSNTNDGGNSNGENDDGSSNDDSSGDSVNVISVADISPTSDQAEDTSAEVTLSVSKRKVENPQQLTVFKEIYDFEAQETTWSEVETSVESTSEEQITVSAQVEEFSLFAVTEVQGEDRSQSDTEGESMSEEDQQPESTNDSDTILGISALIGGGVVIAVLFVAIIYRRKQ
jgi:hypothetical protein